MGSSTNTDKLLKELISLLLQLQKDIKILVNNGGPIIVIPPPPPPPPPPNPNGQELDQFGIVKIYPDASTKRVETDFILTKTIRNYSSGKPSEPSIEYTNSPSTAVLNAEFTHYVRIRGFKTHESDSISNKVRGGAHSSSNPTTGTCYDVGLRTDGSTDKNLQIERPHPSMHDANQPVKFKLGESIVGKWVGMKIITYNLAGDKGVHIESQIDFPVSDIAHPPNNWRKYIEVDDTGQLEAGMITKPFGTRTTVRIDGVWNMEYYQDYMDGKLKRDLDKNTDVDPPDFKYASVREIDIIGGTSSRT